MEVKRRVVLMMLPNDEYRVRLYEDGRVREIGITPPRPSKLTLKVLAPVEEAEKSAARVEAPEWLRPLVQEDGDLDGTVDCGDRQVARLWYSAGEDLVDISSPLNVQELRDLADYVEACSVSEGDRT